MMSRDDVEAHERACRSLIELGHAAFPVIGPADRAVIGVYGAALVARIVGTIEAMLTLGPLGRDADLKILVRSAFEHSVTFAWIAADQERRFARWQKEDAERRIEAHRGPRAPRREPPCSSTARWYDLAILGYLSQRGSSNSSPSGSPRSQPQRFRRWIGRLDPLGV